MTKLPALAALALLAVAATGLSVVSAGDAQAAAPECKTSVGSGNKWTCTTDFKAKTKSTTRRARFGAQFLPRRGRSASNRFKARTIPCYRNPVPGCR
jgi:hypothetical protein